MRKIILTILVVLLSFGAGVFYEQKFLVNFSSEVYSILGIAQGFRDAHEFLTWHLPVPALKIYDDLGFLHQEHWPNLTDGPLLGLILWLIAALLHLSLESSFLFVSFACLILTAFLSFCFFQRFFSAFLSLLATFLLIWNPVFLSVIFNTPVAAVNFLVFFAVFYLLDRSVSLRNVILAGLLLGINFYNSHLTFLFLIIFFFFILLRAQEKKGEKLLFYAIIFFLVASPLLYWRYTLTQNPFYSLKANLDFVSSTEVFRGNNIYHELRDVSVVNFAREYPKAIFFKVLYNFKVGLEILLKLPANYLLFVLGLCGFFYNFKSSASNKILKVKRLERLKTFAAVSFIFFIFVLSFLVVETGDLLIFLPFLLVWGAGFLVVESQVSKPSQKLTFQAGRPANKGRWKGVFLALLIFLINLYPFIFQHRQSIDAPPFSFYVSKERNALNLGSPELAYKTQTQTIDLPPMPRYIEDIEAKYYFQIYSVYLQQEVLQNVAVLRFGGWGRILEEKTLPHFKLVKEFFNGDLYFVRSD